MQNQIHGNTKKARYNKIMKAQRDISNEIMEKQIGKIVDVLVEDISFDGKYYIGRTLNNVPDIDGLVYMKNEGYKGLINNLVKCEITGHSDYDLIAKIIKEEKR